MDSKSKPINVSTVEMRDLFDAFIQDVNDSNQTDFDKLTGMNYKIVLFDKYELQVPISAGATWCLKDMLRSLHLSEEE